MKLTILIATTVALVATPAFAHKPHIWTAEDAGLKADANNEVWVAEINRPLYDRLIDFNSSHDPVAEKTLDSRLKALGCYFFQSDYSCPPRAITAVRHLKVKDFE
jgi:hypothetical protein